MLFVVLLIGKASIQPQTLSRRPNDGAAPSPDIARLKGARLVNMPEPEKGLELNIALGPV